jgi:hypothetical protein
MDLRHLEGFGEGRRREYPGDPARQHRLPGSRRPDEEDIVRAPGRDLECPLGMFLSEHIGEVQIEEWWTAIIENDGLRLDAVEFGTTAKVFDDIAQGGGTQYLYLTDNRGFARIGGGQDERAEAGVATIEGEGEGTADRAQLAIEPQFTDQADPIQLFQWNDPLPREDAEGDREIESATDFAHISRGEVDGDLPGRNTVAGVLERGGDPFTALTHRALRQPDDTHAGQPTRQIDLDLDWIGVYAADRATRELGEHNASSEGKVASAESPAVGLRLT